MIQPQSPRPKACTCAERENGLECLSCVKRRLTIRAKKVGTGRSRADAAEIVRQTQYVPTYTLEEAEDE